MRTALIHWHASRRNASPLANVLLMLIAIPEDTDSTAHAEQASLGIHMELRAHQVSAFVVGIGHKKHKQLGNTQFQSQSLMKDASLMESAPASRHASVEHAKILAWRSDHVLPMLSAECMTHSL